MKPASPFSLNCAILAKNENKKEIAGEVVVARAIKVVIAETIHSSGGDSLRACL